MRLHCIQNNNQILPALKLTLIYAFIWVTCWQVLDPDFGWHLVTGQTIRASWIPFYDFFTYTAVHHPWINHEWGHDVLISYLYEWGGYGLLATFFAGVWTASLCLFRRKIILSLLLVAAVAMMPYVNVRPAVWSLFGFALLLELVKHHSVYIPLLFLIWANLHGGFVIGLALILYYGLSERQLFWVWIFLASVVATFINPYGPGLYLEIAHTLFSTTLHHQVSEWRPLYFLPISMVFMVIWGIGFGMSDRRWFGIAPWMLLASMLASRNLPLFIVAALRDMDGFFEKVRLRKIEHVVVLLYICYFIWSNYLPWHSREINYPIDAVHYLQKHPCPGHLFNDYGYGGYLIWKLPALPIYIDGRMPTWRDREGASYMTRYFQVLQNPKVQKTEFSRYGIQCALLSDIPQNQPLIQSLKAAGWQVVLKSHKIELLQKV